MNHQKSKIIQNNYPLSPTSDYDAIEKQFKCRDLRLENNSMNRQVQAITFKKISDKFKKIYFHQLSISRGIQSIPYTGEAKMEGQKVTKDHLN